MSDFKHVSTVITKSEFDFTRLKKGANYEGSANLAVSVQVPGLPEIGDTITCSVEFKLGGDNAPIKVWVKTLSSYIIESIDDATALQESATQTCRKGAIQEAINKITELMTLHIGTPSSIPLPEEI